ncbi:predicted protein [Nematostella vectensis]|uniref:Uncharacterized protein n=1 Tax=Nematostella vectensis TaxID=45351 RepID=A7SKE1_NEMVE|nr:predicted protein [Nematostella vectensis]|eukprot:XP_001627904.1 predicted protein [Nematostella vectensis]
MDLIDLIGDSRTDSLPPGFLKSIKIKYKQEASHVFPPGSSAAKMAGRQGTAERVDSAASFKSTPSFMSWKVPDRLVKGGVMEEQERKAKIDQERDSLHSRMSALSIKSSASAMSKPGQLPRLGSVASSRRSAKLQFKPASPQKLAMVSEDETVPALGGMLGGLSRQGKRVITKILNEKNKEPQGGLVQHTISPKSMEAVDKWLVTATDKEREIALKFFSTLAGTKSLYLQAPQTKYHTHTEGDCKYCDGDRIEETLENLARRDQMVSRGKQLYNSKRGPDLAKHSQYQQALRKRLPTRLRQQHQTWHHLPIYHYTNGVPNKSSMFTQPHKPLGRHFSIHPEWGLHTGSKPQVY